MTKESKGIAHEVTSRIKTGKILSFDFNALPEISQRALIAYGTQRWINDRVNSITKSKEITDEEGINGLGDDILARLIEGKIAATRSSASRDPFTEAQVRYVQELLKEAKGITFKQSGQAIREHGLETFKERLGAERVEKEARRRMEAAGKEAESFELDGLFE